MQLYVFLTGVMNIVTGALFASPRALKRIGIKPPDSAFWLLLPALFLVFLGFILIYSARDLKNRSTIVFWDGMSRVTAFFGFVWFGLFGGWGLKMVLLGFADLAVALGYFIGLPRALGRSFGSILFDRP